MPRTRAPTARPTDWAAARWVAEIVSSVELMTESASRRRKPSSSVMSSIGLLKRTSPATVIFRTVDSLSSVSNVAPTVSTITSWPLAVPVPRDPSSKLPMVSSSTKLMLRPRMVMPSVVSLSLTVSPLRAESRSAASSERWRTSAISSSLIRIVSLLELLELPESLVAKALPGASPIAAAIAIIDAIRRRWFQFGSIVVSILSSGSLRMRCLRSVWCW